MNNLQRLLQRSRHEQKGVVSLFVVIFATILMTVIVVSFTLTVLRGQQQATQSDLSRSAYDSAMGGVEDAKRAIAKCATESSPACRDLNDGGARDDCYILEKVGLGLRTTVVTGNNREFPLQSSEGDTNTLDQAYTCVTIDSAPRDFQADLTRDMPFLIPIRANQDVDRIEFTWKRAASGGTISATLPPFKPAPDLFPLDKWNDGTRKYPPMIRAQLIRIDQNEHVGDLTDFNGDRSQSLFLYPSEAGVATANFSSDNRLKRKPSSTPVQVRCAGSGECKVQLTANGLIANANRLNAFLLVTPIYSDTSVVLTLKNGVDTIRFSKVQSLVDSTGRANDLFRRVSARVNLTPTIIYPNAALSIEGPLCKNFAVNKTGVVGTNPCLWP